LEGFERLDSRYTTRRTKIIGGDLNGHVRSG